MPNSVFLNPSVSLGSTITGPVVVNGAFTVNGGSLTAGATLVAQGSPLGFAFAGMTFLGPTSAGTLMLQNLAMTAGAGLDFATDAILKVRTKDNGAYARIDAGSYSVGGVVGASKAAGAVTSITVVNGIVTAIS